MTNIIIIKSERDAPPENESFTEDQHLQYILSLAEQCWRIVLRHENPSKTSQKVKHPPLALLSEDDLRRKLFAYLESRLEGAPDGKCYTFGYDEDTSGDFPDIVLKVKTSILTSSLDIECKKSKNNGSSKREYQVNGVSRFTSNKYDKAGTGVSGMISFAINTIDDPLNNIIDLLREASNFKRISIIPIESDGSNKFTTNHNRDATHETIILHHMILKTK